MPTIEELFRSKKLVSGQTAEQQYDIRNTADLRRNPYNVLMTPSFRIAEVGRRNLSLRTKERKLEEEVTGLRILATTTSPFIYGTDIIKFTKKSRGIVEDMKGGAGGVASTGILNTLEVSGNIQANSNVAISTLPTLPIHATNKKYVDARALAMSIAMS